MILPKRHLAIRSPCSCFLVTLRGEFDICKQKQSFYFLQCSQSFTMTFLVRKFLTSVGRSRSVVQRSFASKCQSASELEVTLDEESGIQTIRLNRPNRLNAINGKLYAAIPAVLTEAAEDPKVKLTVLTGTGRFYSSGNDLADFTQKW